jgi:TRAP-type C4-dicarboxylate transport system permease small subunit
MRTADKVFAVLMLVLFGLILFSGAIYAKTDYATTNTIAFKEMMFFSFQVPMWATVGLLFVLVLYDMAHKHLQKTTKAHNDE